MKTNLLTDQQRKIMNIPKLARLSEVKSPTWKEALEIIEKTKRHHEYFMR
jgi:hypothetical protein